MTTEIYIGFVLTIVSQLAVAAFVYGRLTERVKNNSEAYVRIDSAVGQLQETVTGAGGHGERIVRLETKVNGAAAGRSH